METCTNRSKRRSNLLDLSLLLVILAVIPPITSFGETRDASCRPGETRPMIRLTRLNNQPLVVNSDLLKFVENAPDTVLTLVTGEKIIVRETIEQVLDLVIAFRRAILAGLTPPGADLPAVSSPELPPVVKGEEIS